MARIQTRKRKDGTVAYTVTIRKGKYKYNPEVRTFSKKVVAERWARDVEMEIDEGRYASGRLARGILMTELIDRYVDEVLSTKSESTQAIEGVRFAILRDDLRGVTLAQCDAQYLKGIYSDMLTRVTKQTIHKAEMHQKKWSATYTVKFMQDMANVFRAAERLWRVTLPHGNAAKEARSIMSESGLLKGANLERDTRLVDDQYERIRRFQGSKQPAFKYFALFAIETGMRRGEIVTMRRDRIRWKRMCYDLENQKSDGTRTRARTGREVPLTRRAMAILRLVCWMQDVGDGLVWPWRGKDAKQSGDQAYRGVKRIYKALGINEITVHDLRHEFGSYHIDRGLDMRLVGAAMGHKDLKSTKRYTHPDANKLAGLIDSKR